MQEVGSVTMPMSDAQLCKHFGKLMLDAWGCTVMALLCLIMPVCVCVCVCACVCIAHTYVHTLFIDVWGRTVVYSYLLSTVGVRTVHNCVPKLPVYVCILTLSPGPWNLVRPHPLMLCCPASRMSSVVCFLCSGAQCNTVYVSCNSHLLYCADSYVCAITVCM